MNCELDFSIRYSFQFRSNLSSFTGGNGERSLRFNDLTSTVSTTSGLGSNYTTNTSGSSNTQNTPSPRRKTSSNSFVEFADIPEQETNDDPNLHYQPSTYSDYRLSAHQSTHYFNRIPNYSGDDNLGGHRYEYFGKLNFIKKLLYRRHYHLLKFTGSNYFPYRPEAHLAYERDYRSYPEYETSAYHEYREPYQNQTSPNYLNYVRNIGTMTPHRKPQMGIAASQKRATSLHRRTLSSISGNLGFQHVEPDDTLPNYQYGRINQKSNRITSTSPVNYTNRMRSYENVQFSRSNDLPPTRYMSTTSSEFKSNHLERPDSLPFEMGTNAKLRSSRKYSNPSPRFGMSSVSSMQAAPHKNSPTKTTPSDSLTSDDSYLSAKEGSISSHSRVRFSPETLLEDAVVNSTTTVSTPLRRLSRSQRHSISDMLAPNM